MARAGMHVSGMWMARRRMGTKPMPEAWRRVVDNFTKCFGPAVAPGPWVELEGKVFMHGRLEGERRKAAKVPNNNKLY